MAVVHVDTAPIRNAASFHSHFSELLGFPGFYGKNMDAWFDCMTAMDAPDDGLTTIHAHPPEVLVLHLKDACDFKKRSTDLFTDLIECAAFVNFRRIDQGRPAVLALSSSV